MAAYKAILTTGVAYVRSIAVGALSGVVGPANLFNVSTITSTGNQVAVTTSGVTTIRCNNATLLTIQGLVAGVAGQRVRIVSVGAGQVDLAHQNAGAADADKLINFATSASSSLAAGVGWAEYEYDATTARWRMVAHEQGAWITPTFAAGNFTGATDMTWTVDEADVLTYAYYLKGRTISVAVQVQTSDVGGTPNANLQAAIPGGFTAAKGTHSVGVAIDAGAANVFGRITVAASATVIQFKNSAGSTAWTGTTSDNTGVFGEITFEVT